MLLGVGFLYVLKLAEDVTELVWRNAATSVFDNNFDGSLATVAQAFWFVESATNDCDAADVCGIDCGLLETWLATMLRSEAH